MNGTAASGGGSSSYITSGTTLTLSGRTDYTETQSSTQSGLASSTLTIQSATLSNNVCGTFGSATTISGTTSQTVASGNCYLLTLTGTDNVGNAASITSTVKVDTTAPTAPSLSFSALTSAYWSGTGTTLYFKGGSSGGFTLTPSSTDPETVLPTTTTRASAQAGLTPLAPTRSHRPRRPGPLRSPRRTMPM